MQKPGTTSTTANGGATTAEPPQPIKTEAPSPPTQQYENRFQQAQKFIADSETILASKPEVLKRFMDVIKSIGSSATEDAAEKILGESKLILQDEAELFERFKSFVNVFRQKKTSDTTQVSASDAFEFIAES